VAAEAHHHYFEELEATAAITGLNDIDLKLSD